MTENEVNPGQNQAPERPISSNVKSRPKYDRFGETIRYLTVQELQRLFDCIDVYRHKLMFQMIYELGCRVGEFVKIRLRDLNLHRSSVFFPADNTKTGFRRTSYLPRGVMNEVKSMLKTESRMTKRDERILKPDDFLFLSPQGHNQHYSENRLRQVFQHYVRKAGLDRQYGTDTLGRRLHQITVHSLRHSHLMSYIHVHKLPLSIVQKQVGHRTLRATSVYLHPSDEAIAEAYENVRPAAALFLGHRGSSRQDPPDRETKKLKYSGSVVLPQ